MAELPAQPQPQVTTPKSTNWKKIGLTIVFIIFCVSIIAGIYWFLVVNRSSDDSDLTGPVPKVTTKTSTKSAKEATPSAKKPAPAPKNSYCPDGKETKYQNKFKICLPKEYKYSQYNSGNLWVEYSNDPIDAAVFLPTGNFVVQLSDKSYAAEVAELSECCSVTSEKNITVEGVAAVQQIGQMPDNKKIIKTSLSKSGQTYALFYIGTSNADFSNKRATYDNFVSSFRVL